MYAIPRTFPANGAPVCMSALKRLRLVYDSSDAPELKLPVQFNPEQMDTFRGLVVSTRTMRRSNLRLFRLKFDNNIIIH